jgi:uncharacterized repeat protein (TIGR01451 family)
VTVTPSADLGLSVAAPGSAHPGQTFNYVATVTNHGPSDATGVTYLEPVPYLGSFQAVSAPAGWTCTTPAVGAPGSVGCTDGNPLANGASATITVTAQMGSDADYQADAPGYTFNIGSRVYADQTDPDTTNNSANTVLLLSKLADLSLSDTAPSAVTQGQQFAYTLHAHNYGPADSTATLTDVLPTGVTFISAPSACSYDNPSHTVSCSVSSIASGADTPPVAILVRADSTGTVTDSASIAVSGYELSDPDLTNNSASAPVSITEPAPTVHITNPPADSTSTNAAINLSTSGDVWSTTCTLDGTTVPCFTEAQLSGLTVGAHEFVVTVSNPGGSNSATVDWSTVAPAPTVSITNPPADNSTITSTDIDYTETGAVDSTTCTLDAQPVDCNADKALISGLDAGAHEFIVTVTGLGGTGSDTADWTTQVPTTITLHSSQNPSVTGQPVTYTANVTAGALISVSFSDATTFICANVMTDVNETATCTTAYPTAGTHTITARYLGDSIHASAVSDALTQTVYMPDTAPVNTVLPSVSGTAQPGWPQTGTDGT